MKFAKQSFISYTALFLALSLLYACNKDANILQKGQKHFDKGEYEWTIQTLKPQFEKNNPNDPSAYLIGESYRLSNRIGQALPYYQKAMATGYPDPFLPYHSALAAKSLGQYALSKDYLKKYMATKPNRANQIKTELELENIDKIPELVKKSSPVNIQQIQGNTKQTEFAPIRIGNELIFTSSSKPLIYKNNGLPFLGLYAATLLEPTAIGLPHLFSEQLTLENANDGTPTFSQDGNTVIFARGNTGKSKDLSPDVDLYIAKKTGNAWSNPERLAISDSIAWDGSPSFSSDDRTLYFSSNRRGGKGGLDLYRVSIDNSGRFGRPINMGSIINTPGDEIFPHVHDGKLYFATDGHPSIGGLDLYTAIRKGDDIVLEHLGTPINSVGDDFAISFSDMRSGYFSSNRPGGKGDDDIYYFSSTASEDRWWTNEIDSSDAITNAAKKVNYALLTRVVDPNGKPIAGATVSVRRAGETVVNQKSNPQGFIEPIELAENDALQFKADKDEYISVRTSFAMEGREIPQALLRKPITDTTLALTIVMDQPEIGKEISQLYQLNPIYYDLNKADIRRDAAEELDKIVQFLTDNPQVNLELGSHTDARATAAYNLKLSQRRAESAVNYIIQHGIDKGRIKPKGYGETQLINECSDGVDCPEDLHQQNRRTEFKISQINVD